MKLHTCDPIPEIGFADFYIPLRPSVLLLLVLTVFLYTSPVTAQSGRPKIGIALSGGGAKGFAHIGALKVLEEAGIRPDYITGTSMGSIVGGLYALGYPADSLERMAVSQDWDRILTDDLSLRQVIFEEKLYFKNQLLEFPFVKGKIKAPSGLIYGQKIEQLLANLTLPAYKINNFDDLPIPFRCMATDLYWGKPVEMKEGSLPQSIRASMAIPSVFTPVTQDTLILVDGGLIRNFPVQEVRDMGADIIIGIHAGPRQATREELEVLSGILPQAIFLGSLQDSEAQMKDVDLYIEPVIAPYGAPDFRSADSLIFRGERAARAKFEEIKNLADSVYALGPAPTPPPLPTLDSIRIDQILVEGNDMFSDSEILGRAKITPGSVVSPKKLDEVIDKLFGTNYFTKVTYGLEFVNGQNVLTLYCVEKAPVLIKGSLIYDSYHEAGIAFNLTLRNVLTPASRLLLVGRLANNHRYRISFLKYLGQEQQWFLETTARFNRDLLPTIQEGRITSELKVNDRPIDLLVHRRIGNNLLVGIGGQFETLTLSPFISEEPPFSRLRYHNLNLLGTVEQNSLDRNVLPTSGTRLRFEVKWVNNLSYSVDELLPELEGIADSLFQFNPYPRLSLQMESYFPLGQQSSLRLSPFAGLSWSAENAFNDFFLLGSPELITRRSVPFYGLDANEVVAQVTLGTSFGYQYFLWDDILLAADLSAGFFGEPQIRESGIPRPDQFLIGGGLTVGYNSLVGPIKLTASLPFNAGENVTNDLKVFLTFGHRF